MDITTTKLHTKNTKKRLIYKQEAYKIIGILFEVFKELDYGYREKYYQEAIAEELRHNEICFKKEVYVPLKYKNKIIGRNFIDFVIENKIALEIKVADRFYKSHFSQLLTYLNLCNIKLGILAIVTPEGIKIKRIVN